jgi:hypothetical protein
MKVVKYGGISLFLLLILCSHAFPQSLVQPLNNFGNVDWERFVIGASGVSSINVQNQNAELRIQALESAKQAAAGNLTQAVEALNYSADATVKQALKQNSISSARLQQIVHRFTLVDTRSLSDMSIEVDVELPISGSLSDLLLPKETGRAELRLSDKLLCPTCGQPWPEGKPVPEGVKLINPAEGLLSPKGTPYTGLVINAGGLGVNPAIAPKILDEDGNEIYGTNYVDRNSAIKFGMVAYKSASKDKQEESRAGSEPLLIRGLRASGPLKADVIISNEDAILIHAAARVLNFLKECKVVFII